jgi:hypothetical protein
MEADGDVGVGAGVGMVVGLAVGVAEAAWVTVEMAVGDDADPGKSVVDCGGTGAAG